MQSNIKRAVRTLSEAVDLERLRRLADAGDANAAAELARSSLRQGSHPPVNTKIPKFTGKVRRNTNIPSDPWKSPFYREVLKYLNDDVKPVVLAAGVNASVWKDFLDVLTSKIGGIMSRYGYHARSHSETYMLTTQESVRDFLNEVLPKEVEYIIHQHGHSQTDTSAQVLTILKKLSPMQVLLAMGYADDLNVSGRSGSMQYLQKSVHDALKERIEQYDKAYFERWLKAVEQASKVNV